MTTESLPTTLAETEAYLSRYGAKDLLRFITCGSVDDGKSTLIGRLLLETGAVYDDQLTALQSDSAKHGTTDQEIDPALLLDGLEDERQQGITIDVAYRYFQTPKRKFIIADSPGHEQYTRNMATAASTAQAAVILMDARKGMLPQTRRHTFIASLLGVQTLILAVNKMDLVDYDQATYEQFCNEYRRFAEKLEVPNVCFLPVSGLRGDNVTRQSDMMQWYDGPTLLSHLESAPVTASEERVDFRFPVQRVIRPDSDFRGFGGTIIAGEVRVGDSITVLPSRQESRVRSIVTFDGDQQQAEAGDAVTLVLEDEIDVTRGDVMAQSDQLPRVDNHFEANLVWMSSQPLVPGKQYWIKHACKQTTAEVVEVAHRIDVNTLNRVETASLKLNEIGYCRVASHVPIVFDAYRQHRQTGSFILVDRVTHETVAAGMIVDPNFDTPPGDHWNVKLSSRQLQYTPSRVHSEQRRERLGHRPFTVLLTGLSGSGKTTIAFALEELLFADGFVTTVLDGQNLRHGISRDLGFAAEERSENLRRAAEICRLVNDAGLICIAAFVAPDAATREKARQVIGAEQLIHVHLSASLDVCRERDVSGRYVAADRHEITNFPGVTAQYEEPQDADLVVPTDQWGIRQCVQAIRNLLNSRLGQGE